MAGHILSSLSQEIKSQIELEKVSNTEKQFYLLKSYENLIIYYLLYNPDKALKFGESQLKENHPELHNERMKVYIGLAEMLKDDILEAKDFLVASLQKGREYDLLNIAMT